MPRIDLPSSYMVLQCTRCVRALHATPAGPFEVQCPHCRYQASAEAFRWIEADASRDEAERLVQQFDGLSVA